MVLPIALSTPPMEAERVDALPAEPGWLYEPKWDGLRCLVFRDGDQIALRSKAGQGLERYFPDLVAAVASAVPRCFVLDGEIILPDQPDVPDSPASFDALQLRLHPAAHRVAELAATRPARLMLFDLLVDAHGCDLTATPLRLRRAALEALMPALASPSLMLSPATTERAEATAWLAAVAPGATGGGRGWDGVMAKRLGAPYRAGKRDVMCKIKPERTADCVVGGFRYLERQQLVGSLLLGLYDTQGQLHYVGFTATMRPETRPGLTLQLEALVGVSENGFPGVVGFSGRQPPAQRGAASHRAEYVKLRPELVVEVAYEHVAAGRFRHGAAFRRMRPDKLPTKCLLDQIGLAPLTVD